MSRLSRAVFRTLLAAIAFVCLIVVALGGPADSQGVNAAISIRWGAAAAAVLASYLLLRFGKLPQKYPHDEESLGAPKPASPVINKILYELEQTSRRYNSETLFLFQRMLQEPAQFLARATERAEIEEGFLRQEVTLNYTINETAVDHSRKTMLVPLMRLRKGTMLDNLELWDSHDNPLVALLQSESYGLLAYIVDKLFRLALFGDTKEAQEKEMSDAELRLFWPLVNLVCHVGRVEQAAKSAILDLLRTPSTSLNGPALSEQELAQRSEAIERLIGFCDFFADHYLIAVEVPLPVGNRLVIRYSRSVPMYGQTATFTDRLRVRLGLSPYRFTYPLTLPFDAHSYHFRMPAGPSRYLVDQRLLNWADDTWVNQDTYAMASPRPYLRVRRRAGLPYAHFYTRGLNYAPRHELWTRVEFDEVPPGALGGAAIISATCAFLIWFFTLVQPGLRVASTGAEPNIDMPALLLAVPAFAATWVGHSTERVLRSSISAYVGLAVAAATSACSALVYIANSNHKALYRIGHLTWFHGLIRLNNVDVSWIVLALVSSVASAYLAESLRDKVRWYTRMLERWGKPSDAL